MRFDKLPRGCGKNQRIVTVLTVVSLMYHSRDAGNNSVLYVIALLANVNFIMSGVIMGWPQSVLPELLSPNAPIPLTYDEGAWVTGISFAGLFCGGIISLFVASHYGVRRTLLLGIVPSLSGWIVIAIAWNYWEFLVGRFILGILVGMCGDLTESYIAELSPAKIRGRLCASCSISVHLGLVLSFSIGPFLSITSTSAIYIAIFVTYFIAFAAIAPETPFWYAREGNHEETKKCLKRLRHTDNVEHEYEEITQFVKTHSSSYMDEQNLWTKTKRIFTRIENRKAIVIVVLLTSGQQFSGIQAMNAYAELLFEKSVRVFPAKYVSILLGLCELTFTIVGSMLVDIFGRKVLFTLSGLVSASLMTVMGIYFHLQSIGSNLDDWEYLPIACVLLFASSYSIGLSPVAAVVAGECFSSEMRVTGMTIKTLIFCTSGLIVTKMWQVITSAVGDQYSFWTVAAITYLHVLILHFIQPETKGKTLAEIQVVLSESSYRTKTRSTSMENVYEL